MNKKSLLLILSALCFSVAAISLWQFLKEGSSQFRVEVINHPHYVRDDYYSQNIQPILDAKCIACHACYNSPCQLNLTSYEGITRGANQTDPYDFPLVSARAPTRLGIDAHSIADWRKSGFYEVLGNKNSSLLLTLISHTRSPEFSQNIFAAESSRTCLKPGITPVITLTGRENLSMPYGLPELTPAEVETFEKWIELGAPGPSKEVTEYYQKAKTKRVQKEISEWEKLLNGESAQSKLSSRYYFEHLFIAHIHFFSNSNEFFRLVRAKNLDGYPEEIGTPRPFDSAGERFYYRFKPVNQSIVAKTHLFFLLNEKEKNRFKNEFLSPQWTVEENELPAYGNLAANAFTTFKNIPRKSRYQFFLDNARYFIMTFMKGPVCRGQTALNVINDHFWVFFVDPDFDLTAKLDTEFNSFAPLMSPPASQKDYISLFNDLRKRRWQAQTNKMSLYKKLQTPFSLETIWDGDGHNPNSMLTVYRHFDSSDVLFGTKGVRPKTIWLIDYQIFEDIYYNLVAGYNLFGPIPHQLSTRLYMELSRISSEDMFLTLLPKKDREKLRREWSQESPKINKTLAGELLRITGGGVTKKMERTFNYQGMDIETKIEYPDSDSYQYLLEKITKDHLPTGSKLTHNWDQGYYNEDTKNDRWVLDNLGELSQLSGPFPKLLPDTMMLRVKGAKERLVTIIFNKDHYNVNMLFVEDLRRRPEKDNIDVIASVATSYPNFYLEVDESKIKTFVSEFKKALAQKESSTLLESFFERYGISRFQADFWQKHDWFNQYYKRERSIEYGALDLNRYLSR